MKRASPPATVTFSQVVSGFLARPFYLGKLIVHGQMLHEYLRDLTWEKFCSKAEHGKIRTTKTEVEYLENITSRKRIQLDPEKIEAITICAVPESPAGIRRFLGVIC